MEKTKGALRGQTFSLDDLLKAEISIIQYCQKQRLQQFAALSAGRSIDSVIRLDNDLLRVGGQLNRAAMPEETKNPLWIIIAMDPWILIFIRQLALKHITHRFYLVSATSWLVG